MDMQNIFKNIHHGLKGSHRKALSRRTQLADPVQALEVRAFPSSVSVVPVAVDQIGVVRGRDWYLDTNQHNGVTASQTHEIDVTYGLPGDIFVYGSWNGNGTFPGVVRLPGTNGAPADGLLHWYLDSDGDSAYETHLSYGVPGDQPIVGDWDGNGTDNIGVVRQPGGLGVANDGLLHWLLDTDGDAAYEIEQRFGLPGAKPIVGNWNNQGPDDVGVIQVDSQGYLHWLIDSNGQKNPSLYSDRIFGYQPAGDRPIVGNWDGVNGDDFGVLRPTGSGLEQWLMNTDADSDPEWIRTYGRTGDLPVVGTWKLPEIQVDGIYSGQSQAIEFATVSTGETAPIKSFVLRNTGSVSLSISKMEIAPPAAGQPSQFRLLDAAPASLNPGQSWTFRVQVLNSSAGPKSGTVRIFNGDGNESPFQFSVRGSVTLASPEITVLYGQASVTDDVSTIDFGSVPVGNPTVTRNFTIRNDGNKDLQLTGISLPTGLSLTAPFKAITLSPGRSTTLEVRMETKDKKTIQGSIVISNNDPDEATFNIKVQGATYLSGTTRSGVLFNDTNPNGLRDAGESALVSRKVFADLNGNQKYDKGEPTAKTDSSGRYEFRLAREGYVDVLAQDVLNSELPVSSSRGTILDDRFINIVGGVHSPEGYPQFTYGTSPSGRTCAVTFVSEPSFTFANQGDVSLGSLVFENFETSGNSEVSSAILEMYLGVAASSGKTKVQLPLSILTRPNQNPPVPDNADTISLAVNVVPVRIVDPMGGIYEISNFRFKPIDGDSRSTSTQFTVNETTIRRTELVATIRLVGMTARAVVVNRQLQVYGIETADALSIVDEGGDIHVKDIANKQDLLIRYGQLYLNSVPEELVDRVFVTGGAGKDNLYNFTSKPSEMNGGIGNDVLVGGSANDVLYGGVGDDILSGMGGNDSLYGEQDNDRLYGGAGNDGVVGGTGINLLEGGEGADRILSLSPSVGLGSGGDNIVGKTNEDAVLKFINGAVGKEIEQKEDLAFWNDEEIKKVDNAFSILHERTNNTVLLKWLRTNRELILSRLHGQKNEFAETDPDRSQIIMLDSLFAKDAQTTTQIILHEMGHAVHFGLGWGKEIPTPHAELLQNFLKISQWDTDQYSGPNDSPPKGKTWTQALAGSSDRRWVYNASTEFYYNALNPGYAQTAPSEDFAESFSATVRNDTKMIPKKSRLINSWLDSIESP